MGDGDGGYERSGQAGMRVEWRLQFIYLPPTFAKTLEK